ncbi:MAG: hypothetical protein JWP11_1057 [Frankiales bacterium]|nr:hypothetical protein [Frankiales bacterium]
MDTRRFALLAVLAPVPAILLEPLTATAYFRTADGKSSADPAWISVWSDPLARHLHGALDWASADVVYHSYGKAFALAFAGMLCALLALRRTAGPASHGRLRWAPRAATFAYALALLGIVGEYWTPWSSAAFIGLSVPSILLLFLVSPFLGAWLLRRRLGSRLGGWMVALTMPGIIGSAILGGHLGFAVIYLSAAWMLHARVLLATQSTGATMGDQARDHAWADA